MRIAVAPAPGQTSARPSAKAYGLKHRRADRLIDKPNLHFSHSIEFLQDIVSGTSRGAYTMLEFLVRREPASIACLRIWIPAARVVGSVVSHAARFPWGHPLVGLGEGRETLSGKNPEAGYATAATIGSKGGEFRIWRFPSPGQPAMRGYFHCVGQLSGCYSALCKWCYRRQQKPETQGGQGKQIRATHHDMLYRKYLFQARFQALTQAARQHRALTAALVPHVPERARR
jgi:hypothetical protein